MGRVVRIRRLVKSLCLVAVAVVASQLATPLRQRVQVVAAEALAQTKRRPENGDLVSAHSETAEVVEC